MWDVSPRELLALDLLFPDRAPIWSAIHRDRLNPWTKERGDEEQGCACRCPGPECSAAPGRYPQRMGLRADMRRLDGGGPAGDGGTALPDEPARPWAQRHGLPASAEDPGGLSGHHRGHRRRRRE